MTTFAMNFVAFVMRAGVIKDDLAPFVWYHSENESGEDDEKTIRFPRSATEHAMIIGHVSCLLSAEHGDDSGDGFSTATENGTNKQFDDACERRFRKSGGEGKQNRDDIFVRLHETDSFPLISIAS